MNPNRRIAVAVAAGVVALLLVVLAAVTVLSDDGPDDVGSSADLDGSSWVVERTVFDGVESAPIDGAPQTAVFAAGEVSGDAGCNTYFGPFETDGDTIAFGPLGASRRLCPDPPGVDQQEAVFLALLGAAATHSIDGERLTIDTADGGQIVLIER